MGAQCTKTVDELEDGRLAFTETPVYLHLYNLGTSCTGQAINQILRPLGSGAFHCGVEVFFKEYSYSFLIKDGEPYQGSGVFSTVPCECDGHSYSQSISLGHTFASRKSISSLLLDIGGEWPATDYDIFSRNCCHFANDLAVRLGVGALPAWVTRLSEVGAALAEKQCVSAVGLCCDTPGPLRRMRGEASSLSLLSCCAPTSSTSSNHVKTTEEVVMTLSARSSNASSGEESRWKDGESDCKTPRTLNRSHAGSARPRAFSSQRSARSRTSPARSRTSSSHGAAALASVQRIAGCEEAEAGISSDVIFNGLRL